MSHISYDRSYYFQHVYKEGFVVDTAETLYLTPQTTVGQVRALEGRLQGKLFKCKGRGPEPSELGELIYRYTDEMFTLSQEMLDIMDYCKEPNLLSDVSVADALSKRLVSSVLNAAVVEGEPIHLCCFESTHEMPLEQLSRHKLDMVISDCPIDSTQQEGLFPVRTGECSVSFWCINPPPEKLFPVYLGEQRLLVPGRCSMLGYKLLSWFSSQGLNVEIPDEFDDAALMKAFGAMHNTIFIAPTLYVYDFYADKTVVEVDHVENVVEECHAVFAERMTRRPTVQRICSTDYSALLSPVVR